MSPPPPPTTPPAKEGPALAPAPDRPVLPARAGAPLRLPRSAALEVACRRLFWVCLAYTGWIGLVYFAARLLGLPPVDHPASWTVPDLAAGVSVLGALALARALRRRRLPARRLLDLGLGFQVVGAATLALAELWTFYAPAHLALHRHVHGATWSALWVVALPAIVPAPFARVLLSTLASASMAPLVLVASRALHDPILSNRLLEGNLVALVLANGVAAVLALLASRSFHALPRSPAEASPVGAYDLEEKLGEGGMGEVWRARHRLLVRPAAVKLLRRERLTGSASAPFDHALRRFEREAQAIARLQCPHSVQLYDFGVTDDGSFFYVMELLDGLDLDDLVVRFGPQPAERVAHLLRQACESLDEAHERGLLHRDIKPENLFCCRYGLEVDFLKVLDFGLVKAFRELEGASLTALTAEGMVAGTLAFISPEALMGEPPMDARADLYALGCVAYWLLTGRLVFEADNPTELAMMHLQKRPVAPSQLTTAPVPKVLDRLVLDLLAKRPEDRPASAGEVMARLDDCRFEEAWTQTRARGWWAEHLPPASRG